MVHSHKTKSFSNLTHHYNRYSRLATDGLNISPPTSLILCQHANRVPLLVWRVKSYSCCRCLLHFVTGWRSPPPNFQYYGNYAPFPPPSCITMKIQHVTRLGCSSYLLGQPKGAAPSSGNEGQQKITSESQNNAQIKTIGLFSFCPSLCRFHSPLSLYHFSISVSQFLWVIHPFHTDYTL